MQSFQLLPNVPIASLLSLLEVGVGVNLGVAFIDGARGMLLRFGAKILEASEGVLRVFLPLLDQAQVAKVDEKAVSTAVSYVKYSEMIQGAFAHKWLFFYFKLLSLIVAVAFVLAMLVAPYLTYSVSFEKAMILGLLTLFPLVVTVVHFLLAAIASFLILTIGKYIIWRYKPLLDRAGGDLSTRPIN